MKFKVCGLFNDKNIYKVAELNPDYVGHIFWEKSVRYLKSISPNLKKEIKKTGVFFNSKKDDVFNRINENNLACVQLHGDESPQYCKNIMDSGTQVIKSFRIDDDFDFSVLKNYENYCDLFLFDSKSELPGGTGKSFNLSLIHI